MSNNFIQNLLTIQNNALILKIAFVIIRRLQKPHYSSKTKIIYQKTNTNFTIKKLRFERVIIISQGHSTYWIRSFLLPYYISQNSAILHHEQTIASLSFAARFIFILIFVLIIYAANNAHRHFISYHMHCIFDHKSNPNIITKLIVIPQKTSHTRRNHGRMITIIIQLSYSSLYPYFCKKYINSYHLYQKIRHQKISVNRRFYVFNNLVVQSVHRSILIKAYVASGKPAK